MTIHLGIKTQDLIVAQNEARRENNRAVILISWLEDVFKDG